MNTATDELSTVLDRHKREVKRCPSCGVDMELFGCFCSENCPPDAADGNEREGV